MTDDAAISIHEGEQMTIEAERHYDAMKEGFDEGEAVVEPSEEELAIKGLDREHMTDYLAIKSAVVFTDLSERFVDMAVKIGLKERK
jgi:hypothetical protein